jgi:hypothetical protein
MVRQEDGTLKDALEAYRLLASAHTDGLTVAQAVAIVERARVHKLDPFDLWMIFDSEAYDDLDEAVMKALRMRALYGREAAADVN